MSSIDALAAQRAAEERRRAAERARREAAKRAAAEARKKEAARVAAAQKAELKPRVEKTRYEGKKPEEKVDMTGKGAERPKTAGELQAYKLATDEVRKLAKETGQKLTAGEARQVVDEQFGGWVKEAGKAIDKGAAPGEIRASFVKTAAGGGRPTADMGGPGDATSKPLRPDEDIRNRPDIVKMIIEKSKAAGVPPELALMTIGTETTWGSNNSFTAEDHDSLGLYQQRPSCGWGTPEQCLDPVHSTDKFLEAAVKYKGQFGSDPASLGAWCQKVQGSAFPDRYQQEFSEAQRVISEVGDSSVTPYSGQGTEIGGVVDTSKPGDAKELKQAKAILDEARAWLGTSENSAKYTNELLPLLNKYDPVKLSSEQPWCAHFVTGMLKKALGPDCPVQGSPSCIELLNQFKAAGRVSNTPQPGDAIFFQNPTHHVGIVERVENGKVYTVEGNTSDSCNRRSYDLNDPNINCYGRSIGGKVDGTAASDPNDLKSVPVSQAGSAGRNYSGDSSTGGSTGVSGGGGTSGVSGSGPSGSSTPVEPPFNAGAVDRSLASSAGVDWEEFFSMLLSYYEKEKEKLTESNPEFRKWLEKSGWKPGQKITEEMKAQFLAEKLSGAAKAAGGGKAGLEKAGKKLGIPELGDIPKGQVGDWIRQAMTELRAAGVPVSKMNPQDIALIIKHESGGNPNAQNNWDSNAAKGTPSIGLMQTIGPTFDAHKLPGHGNIKDPVDNIIAGVRYSISRYGSVSNVPGVKAVRSGGAYRGY